MVKKYGYGIDVSKATKDELVDFVQTSIYLQKSQDLIDTDLQAVFQEQFEGFTAEDFRMVHINIGLNLRKHLLKRGVYVGKYNNKATLSNVLYEVVQQEEQHEWTDKEIEATIKELAEPMYTRALRGRGEPAAD